MFKHARRFNSKQGLVIAATLNLALAGCSEAIDGPTLEAAAVTPGLFCGEALPPVISVTGSGFAPLPTKTLEDKTRLVLPKVEILGVASFDGGPTATASFVVPDDPALPGSAAVSFVSETELSIRLVEGNLAPGVYDVRVTNPNGVTAASWPSAIAVLPPPELTSFANEFDAVACLADGEQSRTIQGSWFARVDGQPPTVTIGESSFDVTAMDGCQVVDSKTGPSVELCTSITYTMPQNALPPGKYQVAVTNPASVGCAAAKTLPVAIVPPPQVFDVIPSAVCDDGEVKTVMVEGDGFLTFDSAWPTVLVGGSPVSLEVAPEDCVSLGADFPSVRICSQLTLSFPASNGSGDYDLIVHNPAPADCAGSSPVPVSVAPIPTVDSLDPQKLCSGGGLVTISGTGFWIDSKSNSPVVALVPQGGGAVVPATMVTCTDCDPAVGAAGKTLEAQIGPGLVPGTVYEVSVTNPGDCAATGSLPTVTVESGPILYLADPFVVPAAINTRVTLYTTTLVDPLPDPAAWLVPTGEMMPVIPLEAAPIDPAFPKRIQVTVPKDTVAGVYDVYLKDGSACAETMLKEGLTITDKEELALDSLTPPFGASASSTPITLFRDSSNSAANFIATPRIYLNPAKSTNPPADAKSILLASTSFVDVDTLTAVVPAGTPTGLYDIVVVNPTPTAEVGILYDGFSSVANAPPVVVNVVPPSITAQSGQDVEVVGDAFRAGATVSASCVDTAKQPVAPPSVTNTEPTCAAGEKCKLVATIDGVGLGQGYVCVLKVTNTDLTFGEYSAIGVTNSSLNLETPTPGTNMIVKRRGLGSAAVKPTTAARFLYAIAGDDGNDAAPRSDVEFVSVDLFGTMGTSWNFQRNPLLHKRAFFGTAQTDRYVYVVGGTANGSTNPLSSAERAQVLDPSEAPIITDVDFAYDQLGISGLASGEWIYRVSAEFGSNDPHNPGGEGLASDPLIVKLPAGSKLGIAIHWSPPVDCQGQPLPNIAKYHVYRSPVANSVSGTEEHVAELPGTTTSYSDKGGASDPDRKPLPLGSTGKWALLPDLGSGNERNGVSAVIGIDPTTPDSKRYLYALFGRNASTEHATYQYLPITVDACGHEVVGGTWTTGAATGIARYRHMTWRVDRSVRGDVGEDTNLIYVGGGSRLAGGVNAQEVTVQRTTVGSGGELATFVTLSQSLKGGGVTGAGVLAAANQLFAFGGQQGASYSIVVKGTSAPLSNAAGDLSANAWNAGLDLQTPRSHMGSSVQSAFAFFLGGQLPNNTATNATELVVW